MANLEDLIRQRQLLASHLAWLDAEIAAQRGQAPAPEPAPLQAPAPALPNTASEPELSAAALLRHPATPPAATPEIPDALTEEYVEQYKNESKSSPEEAKKGCLILFCSVLGLLLITVTLVYFLKYR